MGKWYSLYSCIYGTIFVSDSFNSLADFNNEAEQINPEEETVWLTQKQIGELFGVKQGDCLKFCVEYYKSFAERI